MNVMMLSHFDYPKLRSGLPGSICTLYSLFSSRQYECSLYNINHVIRCIFHYPPTASHDISDITFTTEFISLVQNKGFLNISQNNF